jgi:hypothetical protein
MKLFLLSIRLDSLRRDPWSTIMTPSSELTPEEFWALFRKNRRFEEKLGEFNDFKGTSLWFVPISLAEKLIAIKNKKNNTEKQ